MSYTSRVQKRLDKAKDFYSRNGDPNLVLFSRAKEAFDLAARTNVITESRFHEELNPFKRFGRFLIRSRVGMENMILADLILYAFVRSSNDLPFLVRRRVGVEFDNLQALKNAETQKEFDASAITRVFSRTDIVPPKKVRRALQDAKLPLPSIAPLVRMIYIATYPSYPPLDMTVFESTIFRTFELYGSQDWITNMKRTAKNVAPVYWTLAEIIGAHTLVNEIKKWYVVELYPQYAVEFVAFNLLARDSIRRSMSLLLMIDAHLKGKMIREALGADLILEFTKRDEKTLGSAVLSDMARSREDGHPDYANYEHKFLALCDLAAGRIIFKHSEQESDDRLNAVAIKDTILAAIYKLAREQLSVDQRDIKVSARRKLDDGKVYEIVKPSRGKPSIDITITDYYIDPKKNGYKSLHINVDFNGNLSRNYQSFEIIIRDQKTHIETEGGEAAHAIYKLARSKALLANQSTILQHLKAYVELFPNPNGHYSSNGSNGIGNFSYFRTIIWEWIKSKF